MKTLLSILVLAQLAAPESSHAQRDSTEKLSNHSITQVSTSALAVPYPDTTAPVAQPITARNVLYLEIATMLFFGSASINYERSLNDYIWLRAGIGIGYIFEIEGRGSIGYGSMLMAVFLGNLGSPSSKIEAGIGGSILRIDDPDKNYGVPAWWLYPAISAGYRYQAPDGGFVFRIGATFDYYYGTPIQISLGHAF